MATTKLSNSYGKNFKMGSDEDVKNYLIGLYQSSANNGLKGHYNMPYGSLANMDDPFKAAEVDPVLATYLDVSHYYGRQWSAQDYVNFQNAGVSDPGYKNLIRLNIDNLIGIVLDMGARPRARAVNVPSDDGAAETATGVVKFVWDREHYVENIRPRVVWQLAVPGIVALELSFNEDEEIGIERVEWYKFSFDPRSRELDFSDATYFFRLFWSDLSAYGIDLKKESATLSGWEKDVSQNAHPDAQTIRGDKDFIYRIQVLRAFVKYEKDWWLVDFIPDRILRMEKSPFRDNRGRSICPLIAQSQEGDDYGLRHGIVRDLRPAQRDFNVRQYETYRNLTRRIIADLNAINQEDLSKLSNVKHIIGVHLPTGAKPDDAIKFEDLSGIDNNQFNLMALDQQYIENATGATEYLRGESHREDSGTAANIKARQGLIRVNRLTTPLYHLEKRLCETIFYIARDFWEESKIIKVTDDPDSVEYLMINQEITYGDLAMRQIDKMIERLVSSEDFNPAEYEALVAQEQQIRQNVSQDPEAQEVLTIQNDIADPYYDFIFEIVSENPPQQEEELTRIIELASHAPDPSLALPLYRLILTNAPYLKGKKAMLKKIAELELFNAKIQQKQVEEPSDAEMKQATAEAKLDQEELKTEQAKIDLEKEEMTLSLTKQIKELDLQIKREALKNERSDSNNN